MEPIPAKLNSPERFPPTVPASFAGLLPVSAARDLADPASQSQLLDENIAKTPKNAHACEYARKAVLCGVRRKIH